MIVLKKSVSLIGLRPEMLLGLVIASEVIDAYRHVTVVTSVNDSGHSFGSLHFAGAAVDIDFSEDLVVDDQIAIAAAVRDRLTSEFDVVPEDVGKPNSHLHIEYQPKRAHN